MLLSEFFMLLIWTFSLNHRGKVKDMWSINLPKGNGGCYNPLILLFLEKYYYLCAIIDLFSRKIISYRIFQNSSTQLLTKTFKQAYSERKPEKGLMFHSDRGTQYMSYTFVHLLEDFEVKQSFSRTGRSHDNAVAEAFFSILKKKNYIGGITLPKRI